MNLKVVWNNLASKFTGDNDLINELLSEIETSYTSPPRYYHNFCHLEKMIRMALLHTNRLLDPDTIMFSIFYHDLVYDPQRNDNEQNSAVMAQKALLKMGVPGNQIMKCQNQILATKDHNTRDDNDTNYLIDFDLAILGDSPENYRGYSRNIRKEYHMFNNLLYNKGRSKVIRHFLERKRIYNTGWFNENYELQARENLKTELETLKD